MYPFSAPCTPNRVQGSVTDKGHVNVTWTPSPTNDKSCGAPTTAIGTVTLNVNQESFHFKEGVSKGVFEINSRSVEPCTMYHVNFYLQNKLGARSQSNSTFNIEAPFPSELQISIRKLASLRFQSTETSMRGVRTL